MVSRPHMTKVRAKNTTPEIKLRKMIWKLGFRGYRIHYAKLQGKPDVAFVRSKKVIFVHGCFWHGHNCRAGRNVPRTNQDYWVPKLARNKNRDRSNAISIRRAGWKALTIWECQLIDDEKIELKLAKFLH